MTDERAAGAEQRKQRSRQAHRARAQQQQERPPFDWDNAVARWRNMMDEMYNKDQ
jgi:hypothetical protein